MASPYVAGVAAVMLQMGFNPMVDLVNLATTNVITDPGTGSPNRLVFLPNAQVPGSPTNTPPPQSPPAPTAPTPAAPTAPTAAPTGGSWLDSILDCLTGSVTGILSGLKKTDSP